MTIQIDHGTRHYHIHGLGFDKSKNEYVIVIIDREDDTGKTWIQIWSSKRQIWIPMVKILDPGLWGFYSYISDKSRHVPKLNVNVGLFANGALHWMLAWSASQNTAVLRFDLETRDFDVIPSPKTEHFDLVVLGDRVSLVGFDVVSRTSYVWELNSDSTWIKIMTIPPTFHPRLPMFRLENGEFFIVTSMWYWVRSWGFTCEVVKQSSEFCLSDPIREEPCWRHKEICFDYVRIPYKKSLVSLENMSV